MPYSLKQAAEATGKDRSTLLRAIKSGRMSATLDDTGTYRVDPAELHRVFHPLVRIDAPHKAMQQGAQGVEVAILRELVEEIRGERDELRHRLAGEVAERERLLKVIEEQASTVKLLTHQPAPKGKSAYWWWFWVAVVLTILSLAAVPVFWPVLRQAPAIHGQDEKTPQPQKQPATEPKPLEPTQPPELWKPNDNGG